MRKALSFFALSLAVLNGQALAQELRAITEDGRRVLLAPDGKWRFDRTAPSAATTTGSPSPYQTSVKRFSVAYNPDDWTMMPKGEGGEGNNKRTFQHKTLPIYAMVIADEIPATTPAMKNVILLNAKSAGAATTILVDQNQDLRGKEVGLLRFAANMKGLDFVFTGFYYADGDGNVQVTCYTAQSMFYKYQGDCQRFLDGLTIR